MHFSVKIYFLFLSEYNLPLLNLTLCSILQSENSITLRNENHSKVTIFNKWRLNFFGCLFFYAA